MAMNRVQFQPGLSMAEFERRYGTDASADLREGMLAFSHDRAACGAPSYRHSRRGRGRSLDPLGSLGLLVRRHHCCQFTQFAATGHTAGYFAFTLRYAFAGSAFGAFGLNQAALLQVLVQRLRRRCRQQALARRVACRNGFKQAGLLVLLRATSQAVGPLALIDGLGASGWRWRACRCSKDRADRGGEKQSDGASAATGPGERQFLDHGEHRPGNRIITSMCSPTRVVCAQPHARCRFPFNLSLLIWRFEARSAPRELLIGGWS